MSWHWRQILQHAAYFSSIYRKGLIGKRLEICLQYFLDDGRTEICWSQGGVISVSDETNIPKNQGKQACYKTGEAVMIHSKKNKERNEAFSELSQRPFRSKWNPMATHRNGY